VLVGELLFEFLFVLLVGFSCVFGGGLEEGVEEVAEECEDGNPVEDEVGLNDYDFEDSFDYFDVGLGEGLVIDAGETGVLG
jgi:hypothetical protein